MNSRAGDRSGDGCPPDAGLARPGQDTLTQHDGATQAITSLLDEPGEDSRQFIAMHLESQPSSTLTAAEMSASVSLTRRNFRKYP